MYPTAIIWYYLNSRKAHLFLIAELKIEVETLKSPARITGIAQANLGMQVARNNIYVQADSRKIYMMVMLTQVKL